MPQALKVERRHRHVAAVSVSAPHMAPRIRLKPNLAKIIEAITWIVAEAGRRKREVTQYDILKTLFLADKSHLNEYGRPVTFDNYYAMKDGPVASVAYNLLKEDKRTLGKYRIKKLPWKRSAPERGSGRFYYSKAKDVVDDDILSPSDVSALGDALTTIKSLTFSQIRNLMHSDAAYVEAWRDDGTKTALMSYGMLFDSPDFEAAGTVEFLSKQ